MQLEKEDIFSSAGQYKDKASSNIRVCSDSVYNTLGNVQCFLQGTIKIYFSAIRHVHICRGLHNHFTQQLTPWLLLILRNIKKRPENVHSGRPHLQITIQLLNRIRRLLSKHPSYAYGLCAVSPFPGQQIYNPLRGLI